MQTEAQHEREKEDLEQRMLLRRGLLEQKVLIYIFSLISIRNTSGFFFYQTFLLIEKALFLYFGLYSN